MTTPTSRVTKKCAALAAALAVHCQGIVVNCDVQARLDGLHQAVYEERDRLLDAINEAEAHARARMLQLRGRVMNNDFDIDALQVPARSTWCPCSDCILHVQNEVNYLVQQHEELQDRQGT